MKITNEDIGSSEPFEFWLNDDINMQEINDSMQIDSGEIIATLKVGTVKASLEVRGEVKVWWNEHGEPSNGDWFIYPTEFPPKLKDIISGKAEIYRKDGDTEGIEHMWTLDDRLYISENNWFEVFVWDENENPSAPYFDVEDAEHHSANQLFDMLSEAISHYYPDAEMPASEPILKMLGQEAMI